jgi:hypothetical protein
LDASFAKSSMRSMNMSEDSKRQLHQLTILKSIYVKQVKSSIGIENISEQMQKVMQQQGKELYENIH